MKAPWEWALTCPRAHYCIVSPWLEQCLDLAGSCGSQLAIRPSDCHLHLLVFIPLCSPLPHWTELSCKTNKMLEKWCVRPPRWGNKSTCLLPCSLLDHLLWGKPCGKDIRAALERCTWQGAEVFCQQPAPAVQPREWAPGSRLQPRSGLQMTVPWLTFGPRPHERLPTKTTQAKLLSNSWPTETEKNSCFVQFQTAKFWSNLYTQ